MSQVWMFLCSGISYCSEFSTTTNYHAARQSLSRLVASEIFPKFGDFVEREETRVNSCNREKKLLFLHTSFTLPRSRLFIFRLDLLSGQPILSFLFLLAQHVQLSCELTSNSETHPRRSRSSQSGREKRQDESFQVRAKEPLGTDFHRTISKNSSRCRLLIGHKKCFVLLCPIGEQFLLSSFRGIVHHGYCLATLARFVHQACA